MSSLTTRRGRVPLLAGSAALALLCLSTSSVSPTAAAQAAPGEVRALWVLRSSLTSPASITALVRSAREHGFNTLLVQVRGRGDAYFSGGIEPRAADLQHQPPTFDPLATVLQAARGAGLDVHAWVNVNLVSSAADLPIARTHVVNRHPEWLMVPREVAQRLARVDPRSPAYVGRLARWSRGQTDGIEGLYTSPIIPAAAAHVESVVRDIARRYDVAGVHLDYARYPSVRFDYSRTALAEFRKEVRAKLASSVRMDLDRREQVDFFAYPDALPTEWRAFRVARMTALMTRLRAAVKTTRPDALFTVAAAPDMNDALDHKFQDWKRWLEAGTVDAVCPMAYTPEPARFAQQIAAARDVAGGRAVWAGIGAYRLTATRTIENIQTARRLGTAGIVLFSYDSLIDPTQAPADYLAVVGRSVFAATSDAGSH